MQLPEFQDIKKRLGRSTKVVMSWAFLAYSGLSNDKGSILFNLLFVLQYSLNRVTEESIVLVKSTITSFDLSSFLLQ